MLLWIASHPEHISSKSIYLIDLFCHNSILVAYKRSTYQLSYKTLLTIFQTIALSFSPFAEFDFFPKPKYYLQLLDYIQERSVILTKKPLLTDVWQPLKDRRSVGQYSTDTLTRNALLQTQQQIG